MAATGLQHLFAGEVDLGGDLVVQVDRVPVGRVVLVQRKVQRRVALIAVVEEGDVLRIQPTGQERVPDLVDERLVGPVADVVDAFRSRGHAREYARRGFESAAVVGDRYRVAITRRGVGTPVDHRARTAGRRDGHPAEITALVGRIGWREAEFT